MGAGKSSLLEYLTLLLMLGDRLLVEMRKGKLHSK
jgi:hypothetical protein